MQLLKDTLFEGERALFQAENISLQGCTFANGESPLKHSLNVIAENTRFSWKYPLWYSQDIRVKNCTFDDTARAGIWYTDNISVTDTTYNAPKGFRRCDTLHIENVTMPNALETLWACKNVTLKNITAKGDYFGMNSEDLIIDGLTLDGNYCFDGARNVTVKNSRLLSKDAFWNAENITCENCYIEGEYLGWNSRSLTFVNCTIKSVQGLCFVDLLKLRGCKLEGTTLAFEYSHVDAEITGSIDSVKNPSSGIIKAGSIGQLIMEPEKVDVTQTNIITE